ncbi:MAG: ATP-binding cassette domain-containing protein [Hydrotalea flava]|uniref:ATP-binding cassette domain-containing protein n=1 Tax=Hydrotalea flava TaxID=714549 RepID=UPI0008325C8C|nr:ATP-binding cassette domain-containing protein [Hydrotalea flava]RTL47270.1 MAG: ATP-binding cassette domain-containing protein [Sphingobacteriales bacterium]NIM35943.1 ATP-binding cassette domain-containing protein [Hydrotalea flava]NIM38776.1 ATP-binding cassette domain-containing protein [Hydrotalea flava]NIN03964.1 ATP-binding cassette domain-containing protein [Hydrotalea flava]NIN15685.1 ATP-binding cassette domain-containing protein [Hydrotalea flava]
MSVEVQHLLKQYGTQLAVNDISFKLNKGEITGFLGPNGAGKSTTMKMITGYLQSDAGTVLVNGIDVQRNPIDVKKMIGYLPESNALYYEMYVSEYLYFVAGIKKIDQKWKHIKNVIALTSLELEKNKKIGQLSKGYKQRVGLAAALINQPEVLILDEPISGLDPNQIVEIRNVIKQQGSDKTVLFSSHTLQEVNAVCDRAIIIHEGKIVANDSLQNLQHQKNEVATVIVSFREQHLTLEQLKFNFVDRVEMITPGNFKLHTKQEQLVRKNLLAFALQENLNILSLQTEQKSLEEVFRQLTLGS